MSHQFKKRAIDLKERMLHYHSDVMHLLSQDMDAQLKPHLEANISEPDKVDIGYCLFQIERWCDDLRKEAKRRREVLEKFVAIRATQAAINNGGEVAAIQGELAKGTPDVKYAAQLPRFGEESYKRFMSSLGVPEDIWGQGLVKADWKGVETHITQLLAEGKPLPPGIGKTFPQLKVRYYPKRRGAKDEVQEPEPSETEDESEM